MQDGSDAVSDWPLLNALLNTAGGATWVSFHHGGGVGMGYSQHAGVVIVCDGTDAAAKRIARVLWNDPATGVMRHADAGYAKAIEVAKAKGLNCRCCAARRNGEWAERVRGITHALQTLRTNRRAADQQGHVRQAVAGSRPQHDAQPVRPRARASRSEDGTIVEMDGVASEDFDLVEIFIARHAIDLAVAQRAMATPSRDIARMIVDINVPRAAVLEIVGGCTPAKLVEIVNRMNVLEMMMGLAKMRARRTPANQAHVTNRQGASGVARRRRGRGRAARLRRDRDDGRRGALRAVQCAGDPGRLADRARRRPHAVRGRGGDEPAPRLQGPDQLFRDALRLRAPSAPSSTATTRRGRRRSSALGLREPRRQDAIHVRRRRAGADGPRGRQVDALPRGAQPAGDAGRREPGRRRTARSAASRCRNRCPTDCAR